MSKYAIFARAFIVLMIVAFLLVLGDEALRWTGVPADQRPALSGIIAGLLVFLLALHNSILMRFVLGGHPPDAELVARAERALRSIPVVNRPVPRLVVLESNSLFGFTVSHRLGVTIFAGSALLRPMDDEHMRGFFAHESGHAVLQHPQRQAVVLGLLASAKFSLGVTPLAAVVVLMAYLYMVRQWEFQADAEATRLVGADIMLNAFSRYRLLSGDKDDPWWKTLFLHYPPLSKRILALQGMQTDRLDGS